MISCWVYIVLNIDWESENKKKYRKFHWTLSVALFESENIKCIVRCGVADERENLLSVCNVAEVRVFDLFMMRTFFVLAFLIFNFSFISFPPSPPCCAINFCSAFIAVSFSYRLSIKRWKSHNLLPLNSIVVFFYPNYWIVKEAHLCGTRLLIFMTVEPRLVSRLPFIKKWEMCDWWYWALLTDIIFMMGSHMGEKPFLALRVAIKG